ncbi:hypothetical protein BC829DRAFT_387453 [Chytridium lagenaria]|nr:hypothetical protein BC829DRAFT_387453 [Chytridium lagenaria]
MRTTIHDPPPSAPPPLSPQKQQQLLLAYRPAFPYDYVHASDCRCPDVTNDDSFIPPQSPSIPIPLRDTAVIGSASSSTTLIGSPPVEDIDTIQPSPSSPICAWEGDWDAMLCPLCATVFDRVAAVGCCGAEVCVNCVHHWCKHRKSEKCPFCRQSMSEKMLMSAADKQARVDALEVRCPFAVLGCGWTGARVAVKRHVGMCNVGWGKPRFLFLISHVP